ncbi:MAG TPA: Ig-like domain-containing protein, partial [Gemmata sp.]|nr:Ig-like domain-containing protein [Gemmata sp.]
ISGSKITSVAPAITVTPGAVSLAKSVVTLSAGSVKSGSTIAVTLQTKDAAGNKETTGGLTVAFALGSLTGGQGTLTSFTDNGNGTYTAIFTGTLVGSNTIKATIDGSPVTSTPPAIIVTPGPVSLANSVVSLSMASIQVGGTTKVTLQAKDAAGNKETTGGLTVLFLLESIGGGQGTFSSVTDNHNGTYTATFKGTVAGSNTIEAEIGGQDVTSTAPSITIL